jgi:16S rRNA (uracil1498-N3)-methyltransferase
MADRYFVEHPVGDATNIELDGDEGQHLAKVMRAQVGDLVTLFDGSGDEFEGRVTAVRKGSVTLDIIRRETVNRELDQQIFIAVALPKGDRQKWLIEKLVELGVARIIPITTTRGVAQPVEQALARLRRQVIEASKQCGRNRLLEIAEPRSLTDLAADSSAARRWFAHPGEGSVSISQAIGQPVESSRTFLIAIGPEGGFTDEEAATLLQNQWQPVSLGKSILRIETAAIAVAAAVGLR